MPTKPAAAAVWRRLYGQGRRSRFDPFPLSASPFSPSQEGIRRGDMTKFDELIRRIGNLEDIIDPEVVDTAQRRIVNAEKRRLREEATRRTKGLGGA